MGRLIVVDDIDKYKFRPTPYIHIIPDDVNAESYKRGWNDAIDVIRSEAETIERSKTVSYSEWEKVRGGWVNHPDRKMGKWIPHKELSREYIGSALVSIRYDYWYCDCCGYKVENGHPTYNYCPNCGANMRERKRE